MSGFYAALDVSLTSTVICIVDSAGLPVHECSVPSTPVEIGRALKPYKSALCRVAYEVGPLAPWLFKGLHRYGLPVACLNARKTRAVLAGQRNKTDKNDARDIAVALSRGFNAFVYVKSDDAHIMKTLLTYRAFALRKAIDLEKVLKGTLRVFGATVQIDENSVQVIAPRGRLNSSLKTMTRSMIRARAVLRDEFRILDVQLQRMASADPVCRRLMTVPGVGPVTAVTFRAGVDDPSRFASSRTVAAHFGLTPRRFQSGATSFLGRISRAGDCDVRSALYEAAVSVVAICKEPSRLRSWAVALREKKGFKRACTATARKLAVILHRMWVTERDFQSMH